MVHAGSAGVPLSPRSASHSKISRISELKSKYPDLFKVEAPEGKKGFISSAASAVKNIGTMAAGAAMAGAAIAGAVMSAMPAPEVIIRSATEADQSSTVTSKLSTDDSATESYINQPHSVLFITVGSCSSLLISVTVVVVIVIIKREKSIFVSQGNIVFRFT